MRTFVLSFFFFACTFFSYSLGASVYINTPSSQSTLQENLNLSENNHNGELNSIEEEDDLVDNDQSSNFMTDDDDEFSSSESDTDFDDFVNKVKSMEDWEISHNERRKRSPFNEKRCYWESVCVPKFAGGQQCWKVRKCY